MLDPERDGSEPGGDMGRHRPGLAQKQELRPDQAHRTPANRQQSTRVGKQLCTRDPPAPSPPRETLPSGPTRSCLPGHGGETEGANRRTKAGSISGRHQVPQGGAATIQGPASRRLASRGPPEPRPLHPQDKHGHQGNVFPGLSSPGFPGRPACLPAHRTAGAPAHGGPEAHG